MCANKCVGGLGTGATRFFPLELISKGLNPFWCPQLHRLKNPQMSGEYTQQGYHQPRPPTWGPPGAPQMQQHLVIVTCNPAHIPASLLSISCLSQPMVGMHRHILTSPSISKLLQELDMITMASNQSRDLLLLLITIATTIVSHHLTTARRGHMATLPTLSLPVGNSRVMATLVSMILRGENDFMLDGMDRSLHDALCIVKRTLELNTVVAGGGAVQSALFVYLVYLATTLGSRELLAIAEFAESILIIPKVLAVNFAKDATELVAKLWAYHHTAQIKVDKQHISR